jgi:WD40 repeat protein
VSAWDNGIVVVWDALTGKHIYTYRGHADFYPGHYTAGQSVNSVAWSPNGTQIASGGSDSTVQVWPDHP